MDKFVERQEVLKLLNAPTPEERLANLAILIGGEKEKPEVKPQFANNHIHTIYSFSPYSPTAAVYCARDEGLQTAGIMDHDSIAGARRISESGQDRRDWHHLWYGVPRGSVSHEDGGPEAE